MKTFLKQALYFVPEIPSRQASPPLSDILLASAQNVQAVMSGRSLSESLAATRPELRAATQAVTFHAMRRLGLARAVKQILVRRTPPNALFDALLLVSFALLDTAIEASGEPAFGDPTVGVSSSGSPDARMPDTPQPMRRDLPVYAVHTVVDQAVKAVAGHNRMRPYKNLLNAALRGFIRQRSDILAQTRQNPEAVWNHPDWWIKLIRQAYPQQWQQLLQAADCPGPMTLRVNLGRSSVEQLLQQLDNAGIEARAVGAQGVVLSSARPVQSVPGFEQGGWSVQDASAQLAAPLLQPRAGMRVLDACAAPGGKTAHLLELADIDLLAVDADAGRLERVRQNLQRLGLMTPKVSLHCADVADLAAWWDGVPFDAVLADVPCTASGIVRRHPDIRWLRRQADIAKTAALQRKIVDALWKTVKPGGRMLYATCSLFPQEGEQQAAQFLLRHADASPLPAPGQLLPLADPGASSHDGFFYALFAKQA